jgi:hypothetical protein
VKPGRYIVLGALVLGATLYGVKKYRARHVLSAKATSAPVLPKFDDSAYATHAPDSVHITVEVINTTKIRGLGRKATTYLRDRGFDVVYVSTSNEQRAQTLVLDRSGHPDRAAIVAKAVRSHAESRPDTTRYVDATVLLGRDWTPPPTPFYP